MAGYKQSIKLLDPLVFLTFDSDTTFDPVTGYNTFSNVVIDESGNGNDGLIITTPNPIKPYAMGAGGLVMRERYADQYAITLNTRGYDTSAIFPYEKAIVTVPDNTSIALPYDFTFMFLMNKSNAETITQYRYNTTTGHYDTGSTYAKSYFRQIFRKGLQVGMSLNYPWSNTAYAQFVFPSIALNWNLPADFHNKIQHITMTNRVNNLSGGQYSATVCVYVNGYMIATSTSNPQYADMNAANTAEIEIGGTNDPVNYDFCNDRQTCPLVIDQFAIFDYALNANQVADLVKKTDVYISFVQYSKPYIYWPLTDFVSTNNTILNIGQFTSTPAYFVGSEYQVIRTQPGPDRLMTEPSIKFINGGMISCLDTLTQNTFNPDGDYTIEFWLNHTSSTQGVVISIQSDFYPFQGILMEVNSRDGVLSPGSVEISVDENTRIATPLAGLDGSNVYWNDGNWHFYTIIRRNTTLELWIDSTLVGSTPVPLGNLVANAGSIYMMGMGPGHLEVTGNLAHVAMYTHALQPQQIQARSNFLNKYLLIGTVTLQGIPTKALIRIFDHNSGQLLTSGYSDVSTGQYVINCYSDNLIDVMILDPSNNNVRPRAYGPCLAAKYSDIAEGI